MISVWWNFEGVLHFELVPDGRAVNVELFCQQLNCVYDKLKEKYPIAVRRTRTLFQQDNAKIHTAKKTKEEFDELEEVEVLPHPAYSLFRSMQHFLRGRRFESSDDIEESCWEFFDSKPAE